MMYSRMKMLLWSLCIGTVAIAEVQGQQPGRAVPRRRALLGNVFNSGSQALKQSLSTQRRPYEDPYLGEPKTKELDLATKQSNRQNGFELRNVGTTRGGHVDAETEVHVYYYGKGSSSSSKSKSKGKGKGSKSKSSKSKSKYKGKGKGKGKEAPETHAPTFAPSIGTDAPTLMPSETPTQSPTLTSTNIPTCSPTTGFFPPEVSGFFQAPVDSSSSDLQNELNNALNDIQVPNEFQQQCVER